ncbi:MAG: hypothetical protein HND58_12015 [Planctomycetota bacterium]|nr:MAG: hypothetical protein HND58_12015 [Planctomycetota bacterium]
MGMVASWWPRGVRSPSGGECAELDERLVGVADAAGGGAVEEGEGAGVAEAEGLHAEDDAGEGAAEDLRVGELGALSVVVLGVEADADAVRDAAAPAGALVGGGLGDRLDVEALHAGAGVVPVDSGEACVHDVVDAGDGHGSLGDVGREDDAAAFVGLEGAELVFGGEAGVEGEDLGFADDRIAGGSEGFGGLADLAFAREEDEHVAGAVVGEFGDGVGDLLAGVLIAGVVGGRVAVADLDGEGAAGDFDDGGVVEVLGEAFGVDGGGGDDEAELGPVGEHAGEAAEEEVDVEAAFVGLVDDDGVVAAELAVGLQLGEQDAVGHDLDVGRGVGGVVESDLEADLAAEGGAEFVGEAGGDGAGGDAAGLGVADHATDAPAGLQTEERELGALAAAGLAADDGDLVVADEADDLFGLGGDGE